MQWMAIYLAKKEEFLPPLQQASDLYFFFHYRLYFMGIWLLPAVKCFYKIQCPNPLSVPPWTAEPRHNCSHVLLLKAARLTNAKMSGVMDVISWRILPLPVPATLCSSSCHQDTVGFWADFWLLWAPGCLSELHKSTESSETDWQRIRFKSERCLQDKTVYVTPWHAFFVASFKIL